MQIVPRPRLTDLESTARTGSSPATALAAVSAAWMVADSLDDRLMHTTPLAPAAAASRKACSKAPGEGAAVDGSTAEAADLAQKADGVRSRAVDELLVAEADGQRDDRDGVLPHDVGRQVAAAVGDHSHDGHGSLASSEGARRGDGRFVLGVPVGVAGGAAVGGAVDFGGEPGGTGTGRTVAPPRTMRSGVAAGVPCGVPWGVMASSTSDGSISRLARRPLSVWRPHHRARNRAAPTEMARPTPDVAVERTVSRARPTTRLPSGDSRVMRMGNVPDVRATTGKRWVVLSRVRSISSRSPPGKSSLSLSMWTTTFTGCPVWFWNVTGISPRRAVRVIDRFWGISMPPSWSSMALRTPAR